MMPFRYYQVYFGWSGLLFAVVFYHIIATTLNVRYKFFGSVLLR